MGLTSVPLPLDEHGHDYVDVFCAVVRGGRADGARAGGAGDLESGRGVQDAENILQIAVVEGDMRLFPADVGVNHALMITDLI